MAHEIVELAPGRYSMRPLTSAEAMHSDIGAWEEAERVYIGQARLRERLSELGRELVIYDVGMGIAANALAAIECFLACRPGRDLRIVSFEKHRDALELALARADRFAWIDRNRSAVADLLGNRRWSFSTSAAEVSWELCEGDFLETDLARLPPADLVFFDFYSPKADSTLWSAACFAKIHARASAGAELLTYSSSTAARAAMLLAGFSVGAGQATDHKRETTIATLDVRILERPLSAEWLAKLARSTSPLPTDWKDRGEEALAIIRSRAQFE